MTSIKNETASQTAGPYVHIGCTPNFSGINGVYENDLGHTINFKNSKDKKIEIRGTIFDGDGNPLLDAMIEAWQADGNGNYHSSSEMPYGWGRCVSDMKTGEFRFHTIKPGQVVFNGQLQAPHISLFIVARGINKGLHTRLYFEDEFEKNEADPLLLYINDQQKVSTLLAKKNSDGLYQFDVHLQGSSETVFLDI